MATIVSENFDAKFHRVPFRRASMEGMEDIPRVHGRYLNVESTDNIVEMDFLFNGLPAVPKVSSDLEKTPLGDFVTSNPVGYRQEEYRLQYVYTFKAARFDKTGIITDVVGSMGESAAYSIETVAASLLNNANVSGNTGGIDNLTLANSAHTLVDGTTTYSNILVAGGPNTASLQTLYNYYRKGIKNDNNRTVPVGIKAIEVAPELAPAWRQLLNSTTQPGQPNPNVPSAFRDLLTADAVGENVYLTNTFDTHILGDNHHLFMFVAENPRTRTWNDNDPEAIHHWIGFMLVVGWTDGRRYAYMPGQ